MRRTTLQVGAEGLLVALQLTAVLVILGVPNLGAAADVVVRGVASATDTVALITTLLWAGTILLAVVVALHGLRRITRQTARSSLLPLLAVAVGVCCLGAGVARQQAATFHACCGSLSHAQTLLDPAR